MTSCSRKFIGEADESAWEDIKAKIDYTYENLDAGLIRPGEGDALSAHHP